MVEHGSIHGFCKKTAAAIILLALMILYYGCAGPDQDAATSSGIILGVCPPDIDTTEISILSAGFSGIVLTPGQKLKFQIDRRRTIKPLRWDDIVSKFPRARIKIRVKINAKGDIHERVELSCGLNPAAGQLIWDAVRTWKFESGCREGELCYFFNAAASTILIDRSRLKPVEGYEQCSLEWGQLHRVWRSNERYRFWTHNGNCD